LEKEQVITLLKNSQGNENETDAVQIENKASTARLILEKRLGNARGRHMAKYLKIHKIIVN